MTCHCYGLFQTLTAYPSRDYEEDIGIPSIFSFGNSWVNIHSFGCNSKENRNSPKFDIILSELPKNIHAFVHFLRIPNTIQKIVSLGISNQTMLIFARGCATNFWNSLVYIDYSLTFHCKPSLSENVMPVPPTLFCGAVFKAGSLKSFCGSSISRNNLNLSLVNLCNLVAVEVWKYNENYWN